MPVLDPLLRDGHSKIMRIRSFIIAYALVLAIILFADRRPNPAPGNRYSHVVDLTLTPNTDQELAQHSATRVIAPAELIPGTWSAAQIPAERLVAPLVVMDLKSSPDHASQITLDEIAAWEANHGIVAQGSVVAIRRVGARTTNTVPLPITADAAQFLMDARDVLGFAVETSTDLTADRTLSRQLALHGAYVVDSAARFSELSETGSLVIVAPAKNNSKNPFDASVRVLAMVK